MKTQSRFLGQLNVNFEDWKNLRKSRVASAIAFTIPGLCFGWAFSNAIVNALTLVGVFLVLLCVAVQAQLAAHVSALGALLLVAASAAALVASRSREGADRNRSLWRSTLFAAFKAMIVTFVIVVVAIVIWVLISPEGKFPGIC